MSENTVTLRLSLLEQNQLLYCATIVLDFKKTSDMVLPNTKTFISKESDIAIYINQEY